MKEEKKFFKRKHIPLVPFGQMLDAIVTNDKERLWRHLRKEYLLREHNIEISEPMGSVMGFVVVDNLAGGCECRTIILVAESFDPVTIAHEAVHVTWRLDDIVGKTISKDSEEVQAYLVGYIVEEIMKMKGKTK